MCRPRVGGVAGQEPSGGGLGRRRGRASALGKVGGGVVGLVTSGAGMVADGGGAPDGAAGGDGVAARSSSSAARTASPVLDLCQCIRPPPSPATVCRGITSMTANGGGVSGRLG